MKPAGGGGTAERVDSHPLVVVKFHAFPFFLTSTSLFYEKSCAIAIVAPLMAVVLEEDNLLSAGSGVRMSVSIATCWILIGLFLVSLIPRASCRHFFLLCLKRKCS